MQSPGDHQRRGLILAKIYLFSGDLDNALLVISHTRKYDVIPHRHSTATLHGLVLARLGQKAEANAIFQTAIKYCRENIDKTKSYYSAYYDLGLALTGLGLISTNLEQTRLLSDAAEAYKSARNICHEKGVIDEAVSLFDELRISGSTEEKSVTQSIRKVLVG
jgi:tetratricopeptide (TPR) repeat protein